MLLAVRKVSSNLVQVGPMVFAVPVPAKALASRSLKVNESRIEKDQPDFAEQDASGIIGGLGREISLYIPE
jgi:hypothetical protein